MIIVARALWDLAAFALVAGGTGWVIKEIFRA